MTHRSRDTVLLELARSEIVSPEIDPLLFQVIQSGIRRPTADNFFPPMANVLNGTSGNYHLPPVTGTPFPIGTGGPAEHDRTYGWIRPKR